MAIVNRRWMPPRAVFDRSPPMAPRLWAAWLAGVRYGACALALLVAGMANRPTMAEEIAEAMGAERLAATFDVETILSQLPLDRLPAIPPRAVAGETAPRGPRVGLRFGRDDEGRYWLMIVNPFPWTETIQIAWSGPGPAEIIPLGLSRRLTWDPALASVALPAGGLAAWELGTAPLTMAMWQHQAEASATTMMQAEGERLQRAWQALASSPASPVPWVDAGFEQALDETDTRAAWLRSLNPSTRFEASRSTVRSGKQALLVESNTAGGLGWLQSPTASINGRSSPRAEVWAQAKAGDRPARLTLITHLIDPDGRRSMSKRLVELNETAQRATRWQRLEFPELEGVAADASLPSDDPRLWSVQFTIEVEGPAQVWLDDFGVSSFTVSEADRRLWKGELYLANHRLTQGSPYEMYRFAQSDLAKQVLAADAARAAEAPDEPQAIAPDPGPPREARRSWLWPRRWWDNRERR